MILRKLNYWIESKRIHDGAYWRLLVLFKDLIYAPVHYVCRFKPVRAFFLGYFGTTGGYEPRNRAIISRSHRFIYFYIPKVASTTLKKGLAQTLFQREAGSRVHHFWFEEALDIEKGEYADYFKFVLVRNPWDRLVSCYCDRIRNTGVTDYQYQNGVCRRLVKRYKSLFYKGMPFDEFVRVIAGIPDDEADRHFRSQISFFTDRRNAVLVDFIGKLEELDRDLFEISRRTGGAIRADLHENKSRRPGDYRTFYTEETQDIVAQRYREDIRAFGYRF